MYMYLQLLVPFAMLWVFRLVLPVKIIQHSKTYHKNIIQALSSRNSSVWCMFVF